MLRFAFFVTLLWFPVLIQGQAEICANFCATYLYREVKIADKRCRFYFERQTWDEAQKTCGEEKGSMLVVRNSVENSELHKILKADMWDKGSHSKINNRTMQAYVWLAGSDRGHEGSFKWYPTEEPFEYTAWSGPANGDWAQPDNYENEEHCVEISGVNAHSAYWNDAPCWEKKRFICEYPMRRVT